MHTWSKFKGLANKGLNMVGESYLCKISPSVWSKTYRTPTGIILVGHKFNLVILSLPCWRVKFHGPKMCFQVSQWNSFATFSSWMGTAGDLFWNLKHLQTKTNVTHGSMQLLFKMRPLQYLNIFAAIFWSRSSMCIFWRREITFLFFFFLTSRCCQNKP